MSSWLEQQNPYTQTLCGTLFTWGVTALGSAMIFVMPIRGSQATKTLLDCSLGFAAGVMLAASYWSYTVSQNKLGISGVDHISLRCS